VIGQDHLNVTDSMASRQRAKGCAGNTDMGHSKEIQEKMYDILKQNQGVYIKAKATEERMRRETDPLLLGSQQHQQVLRERAAQDAEDVGQILQSELDQRF